MIYRDFLGNKVSMLGFGAMRLPILEGGAIDQDQVNKMVDYALDNGVNYFDTAWPYHMGKSETALAEALKRHSRDSYFLANKYPGHAVAESYNPAEIFEKQLVKCGVEYFDYYLLHNVYEKAIDTYKDPKWGIVEYFREQKRLGRIRHLGFSSHGSTETLEDFIEFCKGDMEFCQIQLNYVDHSLQNACEKYEMLTNRGLPVVIMEPLRGGKLSNLSDAQMEPLRALKSEASAVNWAFRYFMAPELKNISTVLSGMSNMAQLRENIEIFSSAQPLNESEKTALFQVAESLKDGVPCTGCGYCMEGCPAGLEIPWLLGRYNELKFEKTSITSMRIEGLTEDKKPSACIQCGKCTQICPQSIDIPVKLTELSELVKEIPTWVEICRQRDEAMKGQ